MIGGFVFQLTALRYGPLALVQPILSLELLLVFGFLAFAGRRRTRIKPRDWLGAVAMSAGVAVFLRLASASGGRLHAVGSSWLLAGLVTLGVVLVVAGAATLSRSCFIRGEVADPSCLRAGIQAQAASRQHAASR